MEKIYAIARKHHLYIIEDCAQSHGAEINGRKAGTFSDISCFSFYPTKPLGAMGDGGMCLTNDDALGEKLRMLRFYGSKEKYIKQRHIKQKHIKRKFNKQKCNKQNCCKKT